jgi:3-oxoacyl-[acyl-carrier protein] reductase
MDRPLNGKVALVTGAGRGIGKAIALRLARDGALVAVHYSSSHDAAGEVVRQIVADGMPAFSVGGDLTTAAGINQAVGSLLDQLPQQTGADQIDILVNNAGIQRPDGLLEITEEDFDYMVALNMKAPLMLVQRLVGHIRSGGRIVNISSGLSQAAFPMKGVYAMTKAALNSFTRSLAKELGPRGITVNAVAPGIVATNMNPWASTPEGAPRAAAVTALGRVGTPEDIADAVAFLCGPDGRWMTGAYLDVSGGAALR